MSVHASVDEHIALEQLYTNDPAAYRRRVSRLVWLGYGYVGFCILVILAFIVGGVALFALGHVHFGFGDEFLRIGIPAVTVAAIMVRAIFVRIPPPEGTYLTGELKARILSFFEPVRRATKGPPIDDVVIVNELNAAVQQRPRWGLLGPTSNYLIIGAPLLQLMSVDEMKAVIAHEFGHLSSAHGKLGARIYRLNQTLARAAQAIHAKAKPGLAKWTFKFFNWFYPRFDTVTFALRRGQEYEADRVAAQATHPRALASALCRLHTLDGALNDYWNVVWSYARTQPDNCVVFPHRKLRSNIWSLINPANVESSVRAALEEQTDFDDSHPCLRDRLAALGAAPVTAFAQDVCALEAIFEERQQQDFFKLVDGVWQKESSDDWREGHANYVEADAEMRDLRAEQASLSEEQLLRLASLEEKLDGPEAAAASYEALVQRYPDSAFALFHCGRILLDQRFDEAERAFLRCAELDPEMVPDIEPYLRQRYEREGVDIEATSFAPYLRRYSELAKLAESEREQVTTTDSYVAATLSNEELSALRECLGGYPEIRRFYVAQKKVEHFAHFQVFVLGFSIDYYHDNVETNEDKWLDRVANVIADDLPRPSSYFSVVLEKKSPWQAVFDAVEHSLVYERKRSRRQRVWGLLKNSYYVLMFIIFVAAVSYLIYTWVSS